MQASALSPEVQPHEARVAELRAGVHGNPVFQQEVGWILNSQR